MILSAEQISLMSKHPGSAQFFSNLTDLFRSHEELRSQKQDLLEALESLLIYGDVYASGADGQSPYGRALAAVARAKGVKENG